VDAPARDGACEAEKLAMEEARRPFDLERGPMMRATLFRLAPGDHLALITMHHIVCDGWSMGVLFRELAGIYESLVRGGPVLTAGLPIQYGDFAAWEQDRIARGALDAQVAYWREQLSGAPTTIELPVDRARPQQASFGGAIVRRAVNGETAGALRELGRREGTTPFGVLLAAYASFLHRYSSQADLVIGCPIANRGRAELRDLIGFFPNTLPLRIGVAGDPAFDELLRRVQRTVSSGFANAEAPMDAVANGRGQLFQAAFLWQESPPAQMRFGDVEITPVDLDLGTAKCDLTLTASDGAGGLSLAFEYSTDLFETETVRRMSEHFETLLRGIASDPGKRISELPLLSPAEERRIVLDWNRTDAPFAGDACAHELFEQQAAKQPDAPALLFGNDVVSYADLNRRANGIACRLRSLGIGPDALVAIGLKRSPEMIAAILGVLKAGGAYLPLSLDHPAERIGFLLDDARPRAVVTTADDRRLLPEAATRLAWVDAGSRDFAAEQACNPERIATPSSLAYVIYTSGSTGRPKGVLLEHRGLCNLAAAQQRTFELGPGCRVLQFASPTFDASVWEIFMALASGACLSLGDGGAFSPEELARVLREHRITTVTLPPSLLRLLPSQDLPDLRTVISAGESCSEALAAEWSAGRAFFNAYGPTEATVCGTVAKYSAGERLTIGRPIDNARAYILDRQMRPAPVGVAGELHIGGAGVARGYLNRPELNAANFIVDPFTGSGRLYKSGDLARYLADGRIEFLGRIDAQVKIRGHRIEPGEIEARLEAHPQVLQCAVVVREQQVGEAQLVAWFVPRGGAPESSELRAFVAGALPAYMIPDVFAAVDELPVNTSGKIDRRALTNLAPRTERRHVPPRDRLEQDLSRVWEDVLGVRGVGVTDDFFELGGNSLLTLKLMRGIRAATGCMLPLTAIYQAGTIEQMAHALRGTGEAERRTPRVIPLERRGAGTPLVLIHPAGGSVICYHELVRELGAQRAVYGIEPGAEDESGATIQSMAAQYIEALRAAGVCGPYRLGGWSSGGVVAFEMARQLARRGEDVEVVFLIDAWAEAPDWMPEDVELLIEVARTIARARGIRTKFKARRLRPLPEAARIAVVAAQLGGETVEPEIRTTLRRFRANIRASRAYAAGPYHGRAVLFRASDAGDLGDRGWGRVAPNLEIRTAPGKHGTLLFPPNAAALARAIREH
jgi:amino acid adenylation domain-containing protein